MALGRRIGLRTGEREREGEAIKTTVPSNIEVDLKEELVGWRRHLHRNPELSFHEKETARFVYDTLESFGNLDLSRPTENSVMAMLVGEKPGRTLAIRADIDALPIQEENGFEFASQNDGVMHACGHDGHTAMLLGTAKVLSGMKDELPGEVRFLFQHAEETYPGGADEMVEAGVMDGVDAVIGIHLWSPLRVGRVGITYGAMMGSPDTFVIEINGKGGHAAMPHQAVDAIAIGSQVVTNLQHIASRNTDPMENLVISVTQFHAGTTHNVLPEKAELNGTVRTLDPELRDHLPGLMERVVKGIAEAHGAAYEFEYQRGYRPVINDDEITRVIEETALELFGAALVEHVPANMGGEDFSGFQEKAPGCFFLVGAGNEAEGITYPHHHPRFTIDEDSLPVGVKMFTHAALRLLDEREEG